MGGALRVAASLLMAARPYLFLVSNVVSLAITAGEISRGISMLKYYRSNAWRPGSRPSPWPSSYRDTGGNAARSRPPTP